MLFVQFYIKINNPLVTILTNYLDVLIVFF